ncbi:hypothetical protein [Acidovorax sp. Root70]|uniref:hypothetical protein n=1 Tax=Acidovorax sp. Root70 TaxID=1736590 RepID=UPI000700D21C|nr:hypothetical protein [Acidovorax sp. Root70]KRB28581.1 hypothetical protein ASD94_06345 [Acidovorax sp. Root70]
MEFSNDCLLISGTYGSNVDEVFMSALRVGGLRNENDLLSQIIAMLGVKYIPGTDGQISVSDLYLGSQDRISIPKRFDDMIKVLQTNRVVRWEDEMGQLLDVGRITPEAVTGALERIGGVSEFLSEWSEKNRAK